MRIAHTMIRVANLEKSIDFYTKTFNLKVFKHKEYPEGRFTLVFLAYHENEVQIELTHNWDINQYNIGDGFGHIAIEVTDIDAVANLAAQNGGVITRAPAPMKFGTTVIAFVTDPDGYKIELIQR